MCSMIAMQNLVVVSQTVRAHVGGPKILGTLGPAPWDAAAGLLPRNTLMPHMCYRINFVDRSNRERMK